MKTAIGPYDAATRSVTASFTAGDVVHERAVNACHDSAGAYDAAATELRVKAVARGVEVKIGLGVIRKPEPEAELPEIAEDAPAA